MSGIQQESNPDARPLVLTPMFRKLIEANQRQKLQVPEGKPRHDFDRRISGMSGEILFALESLRLLAEQGNKVAARLYERETKRLGLWYDQKIWFKR
jgi:hypothetical protein